MDLKNEVGLTPEELKRYSRHLLIPEVGLAGQKKLKSSSVLVVGAGGLGTPVLMYLAAAGVGRIGIVDNDLVEKSNLQRQVIHGNSSLGELKVNSARSRMMDINSEIKTIGYAEPLTSKNALRIANDYDILIDASDNFPTRYLTNDLCVFLKIPNIYGSVYRFDGQVSVFDAQQGPCYRCLFPEPPPPGIVPSCTDGGVLGVLPGIIGTIQATETLKLLLGLNSKLIGRLLLYDALESTFDYVNLKKDLDCRVCGKNADIHELIDYEKFCGVPGYNHIIEEENQRFLIKPKDLKKKLDENETVFLLDVREPHELAISSINNATLIPLGQLPGRISELPKQEEIIVFCRTGNRSMRAVQQLALMGFNNVVSLDGGINAWAREVDSSLSEY